MFEHYTQKNSEASLDAYLASAPAPKVAEKDILKKADGTVVAAGPAKRKERIRPAKPEKENKPAPEKREVVTVTVDTRITDVNLDKFNEKYTELASTKNVENRRKPTPAGNKQKFSGRNNRRQQPFHFDGARRFLDCFFQAKGGRFVRLFHAGGQTHGPPRTGVLGPARPQAVVGVHPAFRIGGHSAIQAAVAAFHQIHVPAHAALPRGRPGLPAPSRSAASRAMSVRKAGS